MTLTTWLRTNFDAIAGEPITDVMRLAKEDGLRVRTESALCAAFVAEHDRRQTLRRRVKARGA